MSKSECELKKHLKHLQLGSEKKNVDFSAESLAHKSFSVGIEAALEILDEAKKDFPTTNSQVFVDAWKQSKDGDLHRILDELRNKWFEKWFYFRVQSVGSVLKSWIPNINQDWSVVNTKKRIITIFNYSRDNHVRLT